jgi:hypothetical protein
MLRFRGHHLICLHFLAGEGYNRDFVQNLKNVVNRAEKGEQIEIITGADDVCRSCPHLVENKCAHEDNAEAEIKKLDEAALKHLDVFVGKKISWAEIKNKINSTSQEWFSTFCEGCDWEEVCSRLR